LLLPLRLLLSLLLPLFIPAVICSAVVCFQPLFVSAVILSVAKNPERPHLTHILPAPFLPQRIRRRWNAPQPVHAPTKIRVQGNPMVTMVTFSKRDKKAAKTEHYPHIYHPQPHFSAQNKVMVTQRKTHKTQENR
jgi:hypothetical protein